MEDLKQKALADDDFETFKVASVRKHEKGYEVTREDGWVFWLPKERGAVPFEGAEGRMWPKGIGRPFRGVMIGDQLAFYRTAEEEKQHQKEQLYSNSCEDLIERWDSGKGIWSIEMGGLGPGYEQAIQVTMIEYLRELVARGPDDDEEQRKQACEDIQSALSKNETVDALGLSGAQFGAAANLAWNFYRKGPVGVMEDEAVKDRHIQVDAHFPSAPARDGS